MHRLNLSFKSCPAVIISVYWFTNIHCNHNRTNLNNFLQQNIITFDKAPWLKEAAVVKKVDLVAVSGQAFFLSRAVWWSELCFAASRMLTGLRTETETLLAAPLQTHCSAHTSEPQQGLGQLFWQLSPAVSEKGIIHKSGTTQHVDERRACVRMHVCDSYVF